MGPEKLLILALLVALVFGAGAVPGIARRAGKGIRGTRDALGIDDTREEIGDVRASLTAAPVPEPAPEASGTAGRVDSASSARAEPTGSSQA
jgi:Sec-independent protein translocase protein TatA